MKSVAYQFEQWAAMLDKFQKDVEKDLKEIRKHKSDVQQIKSDILDRLDSGSYLRDEKRIVISAPEIIIGNVDKNGTMIGGSTPSKVTLRANDVALEGVGVSDTDFGSVITRASHIHSIAVDPGIDGLESVVKTESEIVSQARNVVLQSESAKEFFPSAAYVPISWSGVRIGADEKIEISAARQCESLKKNLDFHKKTITKQVTDLKKQSESEKKSLDTLIKNLNKMVNDKALNSDEISIRTNYLDMEELHLKFKHMTNAMYDLMIGYFSSLSKLAEANRQQKAIETQIKDVDTLKSSYKTKSINSTINIESELINMTSRDGDGNLRTNNGAGLNVTAKDIVFSSIGYDGALIKDSHIMMQTLGLDISTANPKIEKSTSEYPAMGNVHIISKNISMESVDYELKDKKITEKALTKDGTITIRAEKMSASSFDTQGKATGSIAMNAKNIELKSMDVDKEKRTDKSVAAGGSMLLLSEKIFAGARDSKLKSKLLQLSSDKIGAFGETTIELLQGQSKGVLQLDSGNAAISGSKLELFGPATINGKSTFKADIAAEKIEVKNIDIKSSFKSPCTSEGVAIPGAPSTAKLSAKMKLEEMPASESKK